MDFKQEVIEIIESYCQGISYLEFDVNDLPEMVQKIEAKALSITDVRQHRELLLAYEMSCQKWAKEDFQLSPKQLVDRYLANNCA